MILQASLLREFDSHDIEGILCVWSSLPAIPFVSQQIGLSFPNLTSNLALLYDLSTLTFRPTPTIYLPRAFHFFQSGSSSYSYFGTYLWRFMRSLPGRSWPTLETLTPIETRLLTMYC